MMDFNAPQRYTTMQQLMQAQEEERRRREQQSQQQQQGGMNPMQGYQMYQQFAQPAAAAQPAAGGAAQPATAAASQGAAAGAQGTAGSGSAAASGGGAVAMWPAAIVAAALGGHEYMTRQRNDDGTRVTNWDDFWRLNAGHKIADNYEGKLNNALPGLGDGFQAVTNLSEGNFKKSFGDQWDAIKAPFSKLADWFS